MSNSVSCHPREGGDPEKQFLDSGSRAGMTKENKILIIHDRFQFRGGGERLILILANALGADLMTEFWEPDSFAKEEFQGKNLYVLDKGEYPKIVWRYFRAHFNFIFKARKIIRKYDTVIFSGNNCLSGAINCKRGTRKIFYCHSPIRHVFDLWKLNKSEQKKAWKRIIYYNIGAHGIKLIYWLGMKMMNVTVANSENIKKRLWRFSRQKTDFVVYPPIEIEKYKWLGQSDYYFSWGRLERLKRIPDIVSAFQKMPDKKLIVASGGPDLEKVKQMAAGYDNIKVIGWVSDEELKNYIGNCLATIYIPIDEDFGMSPLESMAAGKPCLGVAEGGLLETIVDEKTGKFIPANYTIDDIVAAVNWLTPERCLALRADCEAQAQKFSKEKFVEKMKEIVEDRKIKIGIDASRSIDTIKKTGVEKVSDELLKELKTQLAEHKEIEPIYYTLKEISWLPKESQRILNWPPKFLWTQIRLSWEILWHRPNIFFSPVHTLPFIIFFIHYSLLVTRYYKIIHDVAFLKQPEIYSWAKHWYLNFDLKLTLKRCAKIFVPTETVKKDLLQYTKISADKIVVIHHGYNLISSQQPAASNKKKQILFIGRVEEKKNIANLISAFEIFNQKYSDYKLVLAGKIDNNFLTHYSLHVTHYKNIEFLGYVTEEKKHELLRESACLVLVSKEEGFGITTLEGFDFNLPVLASDIPVLREVGGEACLYVNPNSVEEIAQGLEKIVSDQNLRNNLIEQGREQLKKFDWKVAAEKYLKEILDK